MKTLISLVTIVAAVGIFFLFTSVHYENIKTLRVQAAQYDKALTQSKILLAQRDNLKKQYDSVDQESLDRLKKLAPDSVDNVRLVIDINGIASRRGMTIKNIKIQGGTPTGAAAATIGPDNNPYGSIALSFNVSAPYDSFVGFMQDLERSLRIVDVTGLTFTASDKGDTYDYNVTLKTYWLK